MANPDLIWIEDAMQEYKRSRAWLSEKVREGKLSTATIPGDRRVYLLRSELDALISPRIQRRPEEGTAG